MDSSDDSHTAEPDEVSQDRRVSDLWSAVDEMIDRCEDDRSLAIHGLHLLAINRWRSTGRAEIPIELLQLSRSSAIIAVGIQAVASRIREAFAGDIIVIKGPELAELYPGRARPYADLDLLVRDAPAAQQILLKAGFIEIDEGVGVSHLHHETPIRLRELPIAVELHSQLKWPPGIPPPPIDQLFSAAIPSESIDGFLAPRLDHHVLLLTAHAWDHGPLRTVRELLDIALMAERVPRPLLDEVAVDWGVGRIWNTTTAAIDTLFHGARPHAPLRIWARHLQGPRERTVIEGHLERWLSPLWGLPLPMSLQVSAANVLGDIRTAEGESRREKLQRSALAFRHAFIYRSEHDRRLGEKAHRRARKRRRW